jgi:hypothetical protein
MAIEHKDITDPNIHEPKGVITAAAEKVYVSNGAGSGTWAKYKAAQLDSESATAGSPLVADGAGGVSFSSSRAKGRFYSSTTPTVNNSSYAKAAPTTVAGGSGVSFTEGTNARLTYTGSVTKLFNVTGFAIAFLQATAGSPGTLNFQIYKNGVAVSNSLTSVSSSGPDEKLAAPFNVDVSLATNDYIEVYVNAGGSSFTLSKLTLLAVEI